MLEIDQSQHEVINYPIDKSLYVTAPAGYGKTFVMTERIKYYLVQNKIRPPDRLLALTFTNAAANEMKDRIKKNVPNSEKIIEISNFHTFAYFLLRTYGNYIKLNRNFLILDEEEKNEFKFNFLEEKIQQGLTVCRDIYFLKNNYDCWYNSRFLQNKHYSCEDEDVFLELYEGYKKQYIKEDCLDFDHLLFKAIELIQKKNQLKDLLFSKYVYLLIDEFQDTNFIQYLLFKEIATNSKGQKRQVFVVGDRKQSIMKFQGANPQNLDFLIRDFNCVSLELKKNHRTSSKKIISITNILRGTATEEDNKQRISVFINDTVEEENNRIIQIIKYLESKGKKLHEIALLFPQTKTSNQIKKALTLNNIESFFINEFKFNAFKITYSDFFTDLKQIIRDKINEKNVNILINEIIKKHYTNNNDFVLSMIINFSYRFDSGDYKHIEVWKRVQEFYNYLEMEIDWEKLIQTKIKDKVFLSTIHGSKGLEFNYIILFGIVNYRLPYHTNCFSCGKGEVDISEAEDLFYVAVSRAIKDIFFVFSKQDEQNLNRTTRRLSCVFQPILSNAEFIDINSNSYGLTDEKVTGILCNNED